MVRFMVCFRVRFCVRLCLRWCPGLGIRFYPTHEGGRGLCPFSTARFRSGTTARTVISATLRRSSALLVHAGASACSAHARAHPPLLEAHGARVEAGFRNGLQRGCAGERFERFNGLFRSRGQLAFGGAAVEQREVQGCVAFEQPGGRVKEAAQVPQDAVSLRDGFLHSCIERVGSGDREVSQTSRVQLRRADHVA